MSIVEYLEDVLCRVESHSLVRRLHVRNMHVSFRRGYVRFVAFFVDDSELHVFEYVNSDLRNLSYAYHYQNALGYMVFRYDNASNRSLKHVKSLIFALVSFLVEDVNVRV